MQQEKKSVLVTGAASGIGKAVAEQFAAKGHTIGLVDIDQQALDELAEKLTSHGSKVITEVIDVSNAEQLRTGLHTILKKLSTVDVVHCNAGINGLWAPIEDLPFEEWNRTIDTNLRSTFVTVQSVIPFMKKQGGSIVITSSVNGTRVFDTFGASAYSTSKAGQVAFAKMAALELARYNIRVNVVCPGKIETSIEERTTVEETVDAIKIPVEYPEGSRPLKRQTGTPEYVANVVHFLASEESGNVSGSVLFVDGAESLL